MLVRVLEIAPSTGAFHFAGGQPLPFVEVDWFRDEYGMMATEDGRSQIADFVKGKRYFNQTKPYLVLAEAGAFTINYSAP